MYKLILASQSPRRADILREAQIPFTAFTPNLSENLNKNISLRVAVEALALDKAKAVVTQAKLLKPNKIIVLSADTVVSCEDQVLEKPKNIQEAEKFLRLLSGREHIVWTGFCLWNLENDEMVLDSDSTKVWFKQLSDEVLQHYLSGDDWRDKAGAYGVQSEGAKFVERIDGSFRNVMGLPIEKILVRLKEKSWHVAGD